MNVAVKARSANAIRLHHDGVIRFVGHSHAKLAISAVAPSPVSQKGVDNCGLIAHMVLCQTKRLG
jgi:hypothetical protein